ncbi:DUF3310 domain-containing protein [Halodesulfovibrio aestuarii]|uniref:DUF3310 domain-containing protein n=1 Tax=Halodesulfovibrio aestuarii TaxID=126333 RepID=UPI003D33F87D
MKDISFSRGTLVKNKETGAVLPFAGEYTFLVAEQHPYHEIPVLVCEAPRIIVNWKAIECEEFKTAEQEIKQLLELRELDLAYISNLEASNESLSKQKSILAWVAAMYHDRFIDLTITERDSDQLACKKEQENTCHHCGKELAEVECIELTEHMNFNLGNAFKYLHRAWLKNNAEEDLKKALWYIEREQERSLTHGRFYMQSATTSKAHQYFMHEKCPARLAIWNYIEIGNQDFLDDAARSVRTKLDAISIFQPLIEAQQGS